MSFQYLKRTTSVKTPPAWSKQNVFSSIETRLCCQLNGRTEEVAPCCVQTRRPIDTTRIVRGRSSVYETTSVHLSVPSFGRRTQLRRVCYILWARQAGDIDRQLAHSAANASSATLSAYVGSWTETCLHSLVLTADKMKSEMSRKCRTDQCHCSDTRVIFFKSVNIWQSYRQKRDCLVHFLCLLAVCWPGAQSAWDNHALTCNYAKYSPIKKHFSHSYIQQ